MEGIWEGDVSYVITADSYATKAVSNIIIAISYIIMATSCAIVGDNSFPLYMSCLIRVVSCVIGAMSYATV